ncbi:MAG: flagellar export protein FliJ [Clostridiales bacterium]|nr:flagellar export protein FliJ [Clostridiales bacterium]
MAFKYRLESYLDVKSKIEGQRKIEYGVALSKLDEEINKKKLLCKQKDAAIADFKLRLGDKIYPGLYRDTNNYIELLKRQIIKQDDVIAQAGLEVERKRDLLTEAVKERKTLEKLKEKNQIEYNREQIIKEQKLVDEITSYKFSKQT